MPIEPSTDDVPQRKYKWPWIALGMVILGIVLAIVWMTFAVLKVERERDFNAPPPAQHP